MAVTLNANSSTGFIATSDTSGVLQLQTGGTTAVTVDASQNVGIGTASPVLKLDVSGKVKFTGVEIAVSEDYTTNLYYSGGWKYRATGYGTTIGASSGAITFNNTASSGTADAAATLSERMRIDSSGNVGIGTSSPTYRLHLDNIVTGDGIAIQDGNDSGSVGLYFLNGSDVTVGSIFGLTNNTGMSFQTNGSERARIDSDGVLLVGKTSFSGTSGTGTSITPGGRVNVVSAATTNATSTYEVYSTGAANYRFYVGLGGTVFATSATITAISDQRWKENIRDLDDGLDVVMALKPRKFDWKEGKGADTKNARGFIAQEFETVFPDLIDTWKDEAPEGEEPYKAVRADLIPTLVKAIQEMKAIIDTQTITITQLQADVTALKGTTP